MVLLAVMSLPAHAWSHGSLTFTGYSSGNGSGTHACTTITSGYAHPDRVRAQARWYVLGDGWSTGSATDVATSSVCTGKQGPGYPDDTQGLHRVSDNGWWSATYYS
ncbi:hypothetical protein [Euzebya pacifica]|uniref:hypothetical protein n=1 Tax=Euzebya pacifica TaxID=1608957 RepID=UPI0013E01AD4|nr:hypothetical protein [Euzebya pacifica]